MSDAQHEALVREIEERAVAEATGSIAPPFYNWQGRVTNAPAGFWRAHRFTPHDGGIVLQFGREAVSGPGATVYAYYKRSFPATSGLVFYSAALQAPSITRRPAVATIVRVYGYMFVPGSPPDIKELHQGQWAGFLRTAPTNKAHDVVLGTFILLSKFGTYGESIVRFSSFHSVGHLGAGADRELKEEKASAVEAALAEADETAEAIDFTPGS